MGCVGGSSSRIAGMFVSLTFFKNTTGACGINPGSLLIRIRFSDGAGDEMMLLFDVFFSGFSEHL